MICMSSVSYIYVYETFSGQQVVGYTTLTRHMQALSILLLLIPTSASCVGGTERARVVLANYGCQLVLQATKAVRRPGNEAKLEVHS